MQAQSQSVSVDSLVDIMVADPDRFKTPKYAEMGMPMFLIGEDLTSGVATTPWLGGATDSLGGHFAELAGALARRKPALDLDDVARVLEVLAEQHFMPHDAEFPGKHGVQWSTALPLPETAPPVLAELVAGMAHSRAIRLINFHATPRYREAEFRKQIAAYAHAFEPITPANFAAAVEGRWSYERPGLMPALFEGYRDNLDVMLPILEEFGFTGWFFVPSGFLNVPMPEQRSYAADHKLHLPQYDEYPGERIVLTWEEVREIARRGHRIACHTRTHNEVTAETPRAVLEDEIIVAKAEMESELGTGVEIFCWLEGAALGVNPEADEMLRQAGFRYLFSNFKVQKMH